MANVDPPVDRHPAYTRSLERIGPCIVPGCVLACRSFVMAEYADGFRTCECGHTQHAHQFGKVQ